jgi:hypothetical protein
MAKSPLREAFILDHARAHGVFTSERAPLKSIHLKLLKYALSVTPLQSGYQDTAKSLKLPDGGELSDVETPLYKLFVFKFGSHTFSLTG